MNKWEALTLVAVITVLAIVSIVKILADAGALG